MGLLRIVLVCLCAWFALNCACEEPWERRDPAVFAPEKKDIKACTPEPKWTLYVDATKGDDVATGKCSKPEKDQCGPLKTIKKAIELAKAGDAIHLNEGVWKEALTLTRSGRENKAIAIGSTQKAVIEGTIHLKGASHITLWGVTLHSRDGFSWLVAKGGEHHLSFQYVGFDSFHKKGGAFQGVYLLGGNDIRFCGCKLGQWLGDAIYSRETDRFDFAYNDSSRGKSDHGVLAYTGNDLRVRHNTFHNPWDRVLHITDDHKGKKTSRAVIEHNVFVRSNWDRKSRRPITAVDIQDGGGAWEVIRALGSRHIIRNNILIAAGKGPGHACVGALTFTTFSNSYYHSASYAHMRVYHNTFYSSLLNDVAFVTNATPENLDDNRVIRNVFAKTGTHAISWCKQNIIKDNWLIQDNLFATPSMVQDGEGQAVSVASISKPLWKKNVVADIAFQDADAWRRGWSHAKRSAFWAQYQLKKAPKALGPIATLTEDAKDATSLTVSDAFVFSDGGRIVEGDAIKIGETTTRVTKVLDATHIEIADAITAKKGAGVAFVGGRNIPGIYAP